MSHVYEKVDFYSSYSSPLVYPEPDNRLLARYKGPEFPGTLEGTEPPIDVWVHYHPIIYRRAALERAKRILEKYSIVSGHRVVVFGGAYGWLCEALSALTQCTAISVDLSQHVQDTKNLSADDELEESIVASGLSISSGNGQIVFNDFSDPNPRTSAVVLQEDLREQKAVNSVKREFGNQTPTHVITESVWSLLTDAEKADYQAVFDSLGATSIHIINQGDGEVVL